MFFVSAMFLAIRGATGAVAIYIPYQQYWVEDRLFYPLDTFPEYLTLVILSWPAFMARMAQSYPRALQDQGKNRKDRQKRKGKTGPGQQQEAGGHASGGLANGKQADEERTAASGALTNGQHAGNGQVSQL